MNYDENMEATNMRLRIQAVERNVLLPVRSVMLIWIIYLLWRLEILETVWIQFAILTAGHFVSALFLLNMGRLTMTGLRSVVVFIGALDLLFAVTLLRMDETLCIQNILYCLFTVMILRNAVCLPPLSHLGLNGVVSLIYIGICLAQLPVETSQGIEMTTLKISVTPVLLMPRHTPDILLLRATVLFMMSMICYCLPFYSQNQV